jgi:hypothetical protein
MNRERKLPFMAAALIALMALSAWSSPRECKKPKATLLTSGLHTPLTLSERQE